MSYSGGLLGRRNQTEFPATASAHEERLEQSQELIFANARLGKNLYQEPSTDRVVPRYHNADSCLVPQQDVTSGLPDWNEPSLPKCLQNLSPRKTRES